MAAHERSRDQFDNLEVLLQVLDDALWAENREFIGPTRRTAPTVVFHARACFHLVLLLIRLLNERSSDLVQLPERRNHPDGLRTALLGGLWGGDVKLW